MLYGPIATKRLQRLITRENMEHSLIRESYVSYVDLMHTLLCKLPHNQLHHNYEYQTLCDFLRHYSAVFIPHTQPVSPPPPSSRSGATAWRYSQHASPSLT